MALALGVTIALSLVSLGRVERAEAARQLRSSRAMLERVLQERSRQLETAAQVIVADFAFKEALATGDRATMRSALGNQASRINAAVAVLYGVDGQVMATTLNGAAADSALALHAPMGDKAAGPTYAVLGGHPYQLVLSPVRAPETIAWVALGFALDASLAQQLRQLGGTEISFIAVDQTGRNSDIVSTLNGAQAPDAWLPELAASAAPMVHTQDGVDYLTLGLPLNADGGRVQLIVQRSLKEVNRQYRLMSWQLLLIAGASLLGAIVVALLAGRSAVRPLGTLVTVAQRIERGDETDRVVVGGGEEFSHLADTLWTMGRSIREREARIVHQATHDALTGLPNRQGVRELLLARQQAAGELSVALIDIHRFRDINASVGHARGDRLLQFLAARLVRAPLADGLVARVGADQFLIVQPMTDLQLVACLAELDLELGAGAMLDGQKISVGLRSGVSAWRAPRVGVDDLLRQCDVALGEAKEKGEPLRVYQASHDAEQRRRITLVADLRQALAGNTGLRLDYQPLVRMTTHEIAGFEALVRWTHPTLGPISPAEFVPLAERASAIGELSRWVLAEAISQMGQWRMAGLELEVALNLSAGDMADRGLPARVLALLQQHRVEPSQLMLEVTESAVMADPQTAAAVMQQLRRAGVRFAIDDFGTGHSSLAQLHALPVDELKIDRAFVMNLDTAANNLAIVRTTVELGHSLGLRVVAEGIETPEAWSALLRLGCDVAQGYIISRPMRSNQVAEWVRVQRAELARAVNSAEEVGTLSALRPRSA